MATNTLDKNLEKVREAFSREYLDRSRGIYSIGIGREQGVFCLRVSGNAQALKRVPANFRGMPVCTRVGGPGIVGLARR